MTVRLRLPYVVLRLGRSLTTTMCRNTELGILAPVMGTTVAHAEYWLALAARR